VPVDVSREDRGEAGRDRAAGDHVARGAERETDRPDGRPLDGLVHGEQADVCRGRLPAAPLEKIGEHLANRVAVVREAGDRHGDSARGERHGARAVDDVDPGMRGEEREGNRGALVVSRDDDDGHPGVRDPLERRERPQHQIRFHPAAIEDVASVDPIPRV
jgi:hypothetical protein